MKLALLFSGQVRPIDKDIFSQGLKKFTAGHSADIYVCSWDNVGITQYHGKDFRGQQIPGNALPVDIVIDNLFEGYNVIDKKIFNYLAWQGNLPNEYKNIIDNKSFSSITKNSLPQIYLIEESCKMVKDMSSYDFILRVRFDSVFIKSFNEYSDRCLLSQNVDNHPKNSVYDIFFGAHPLVFKLIIGIWEMIPSIVNSLEKLGFADGRDAGSILYYYFSQSSLSVVNMFARYCDVYRPDDTPLTYRLKLILFGTPSCHNFSLETVFLRFLYKVIFSFKPYILYRKLNDNKSARPSLGIKNSNESTPRQVYLYYQSKFFNLPFNHFLRQHRRYFTRHKRGFGEDSFHAFWLELLTEYQPANILEIGVYRGQTLSLFALISKKYGFISRVIGISPLSHASDNFSNYLIINYLKDIEKNLSTFGVSDQVNLINAYSNETNGLQAIKSNIWDLVYINGSHDYHIVKSDLDASFANLCIGGFLVIDDSFQGQDYDLPFYAFSGHPHVKIVVKEFLVDNQLYYANVGHLTVVRKSK